MTHEQAASLARLAYEGHPAVAALVLEACHGATADRRERSRRALLLLDPAEPLPDLLSQSPTWQAALAIATLLVASVCTTRKTRQRVAGLLQAISLEARVAAADAGVTVA